VNAALRAAELVRMACATSVGNGLDEDAQAWLGDTAGNATEA